VAKPTICSECIYSSPEPSIDPPGTWGRCHVFPPSTLQACFINPSKKGLWDGTEAPVCRLSQPACMYAKEP